MSYNPDAPLIIQSDRTILLEAHHPRAEEARDALLPFAELEKSPEHVHSYRVTPLSLWHAAAAGLDAQAVLGRLTALSRYPLPAVVAADVQTFMGRYGQVQLHPAGPGALALRIADPALAREIAGLKALAPYWLGAGDPAAGAAGGEALRLAPQHRGELKQALARLGYPVEDHAGFQAGEPLSLALRATTAQGRPFAVRPYQQAAVDAFTRAGSAQGGHGVIVLPCGAGKTIVGMAAMAAVGMRTLVLTTNRTAVNQWRAELLDKTSLAPEQIGEYTGERKELGAVTLSTYQLLTHRRSRDEALTHQQLFSAAAWGLIIYDEVHTLPAPVFRLTAALQATRRLGLTATLIREDGLETDVFSLIGPKRAEVPWKVLEASGHIATARCHELRVPLAPADRLAYATAPERQKHRLAAENPAKLEVVRALLAKHARDQVLVIGQYLDQVAAIAEALGAPLITGQVPQAERDRLYQAFRDGEVPVLVVSKVANFAVDLPDANVAIQVSGAYGSRQEEAQRLGRLLRPKAAPVSFYTLVSRDTNEETFALKRQLFLIEQGYAYEVGVWEGG